MHNLTTDSYYFKDFRGLTESEILSTWELRNHPDIRKWMTHPDPIEFANHRQFIKSLSDRNDVRYYLVEDKSGNIIGSVNISYISENKVERGIYINPVFQGKGHAKRMLQEFYDILHREYFIKTIVTKVLKENAPSNALERSLGAVSSCGTSTAYNYYILNL